MLRLIQIFFFTSFLISQDMQAKYVTAYTIDAKIFGEFETILEYVAAPSYARLHGEFSAKRWIFRWLNGERGALSVPGTNNTLSYNVKRERYWLNPPGKHNFLSNLFADWKWGKENNTEDTEKDLKTENEEEDKNEFFTEFYNDIFEEGAVPHISRYPNNGIEEVNGFKSKKWTTSIATKKNKMVIEEWMVGELPLRDSLFLYIESAVKSDTSSTNLGMLRLSSYDFIIGLDSTSKIERLNGNIVMAKLSIDSDKSFLKSASFEIRELYMGPFSASSFAIPKEFERIELVKGNR